MASREVHEVILVVQSCLNGVSQTPIVQEALQSLVRHPHYLPVDCREQPVSYPRAPFPRRRWFGHCPAAACTLWTGLLGAGLLGAGLLRAGPRSLRFIPAGPNHHHVLPGIPHLPKVRQSLCFGGAVHHLPGRRRVVQHVHDRLLALGQGGCPAPCSPRSSRRLGLSAPCCLRPRRRRCWLL